MAKDLQTDFDATQFLETYRDDVQPKYRKAKDRESPVDITTAPSAPSKPDKRDELAKMPKNPDHNDAEEDYLHRFVENCPVESFNKHGRQIMVVGDHRKKIQKILALFGEDGTLSSYVYNVLENHFKEFDPIIQSLYRKCKQI